jgi:hypothetical protein
MAKLERILVGRRGEQRTSALGAERALDHDMEHTARAHFGNVSTLEGLGELLEDLDHFGRGHVIELRCGEAELTNLLLAQALEDLSGELVAQREDEDGGLSHAGTTLVNHLNAHEAALIHEVVKTPRDLSVGSSSSYPTRIH